jgi:hypothetical protein
MAKLMNGFPNESRRNFEADCEKTPANKKTPRQKMNEKQTKHEGTSEGRPLKINRETDANMVVFGDRV